MFGATVYTVKVAVKALESDQQTRHENGRVLIFKDCTYEAEEKEKSQQQFRAEVDRVTY